MDAKQDFESFIRENSTSDANSLRLKYAHKDMPFDVEYAITQIECRRKTAFKLPFLLSNPKFRFPSVLSAEQSTCECLAKFHASLIEEGASVLDMTCGLGVDDYYISRRASVVTTFEIVDSTAKTARENFKVLEANNIKVKTEDSLNWLKDNPGKRFDVIFADPARRGEFNRRTYALKDCSPNITANLDLIREHTDKLILKVSPMLDISQLCKELRCVKCIWILSVKNECKELLVECDVNEDRILNPVITAINYKSSDNDAYPSVVFRMSDRLPVVKIVEDNPDEMIGSYIFEPDSSLMKSGATSIVANKFGLQKLHTNTSLYIGKEFLSDFPGRVFQIRNCFTFNKLIKNSFKGENRNVICRNFPMKPASVISKANIKEGSDTDYLICASVGNKKKNLVFDCKKM